MEIIKWTVTTHSVHSIEYMSKDCTHTVLRRCCCEASPQRHNLERKKSKYEQKMKPKLAKMEKKTRKEMGKGGLAIPTAGRLAPLSDSLGREGAWLE